MKTISVEEVAELIKRSPAAFICSPNYESRSISATITWLSLLEQYFDDVNINVHIPHGITITLQAKEGKVPPLEDLKRENIAILNQKLKKLWPTSLTELELPYPNDSAVARYRIKTEITSILKRIKTTTDKTPCLIVDISALPRQVLFALFDSFRTWKRDGMFNELILLYTWAQSYPDLRYPTQVGELEVAEINTLREKLPLAEWLKPQKGQKSRASIFFGRQGFDSKYFLDITKEFNHIDLFGFLNRLSLKHSFETYRANAPILASQHPLHNFLTIGQGYSLLNNTLNNGTIGNYEVTVIAPFNSKPLLFAALLIANVVLKAHPAQKIAIATLPAHHYGTVYSIGADWTEAYWVNFDNL